MQNDVSRPSVPLQGWASLQLKGWLPTLEWRRIAGILSSFQPCFNIFYRVPDIYQNQERAYDHG